MRVSSEFSKYATSYGSYSVIQDKVIQRLMSTMIVKPKRILDLGCGSGGFVKSITWNIKYFVGVDFAKGMLELHPKSEKIECIYGDFNKDALFETLKNYQFDFIVSASALQWADDLEKIFQNIQSLNIPVALAIFTSNTFKTLYDTADLEPILKSSDAIFELQKKYFDADFEIVQYKLEFENTREIFQYIKRSGVSGSRRVLDYRNMKKLIKEYPINYLEFEVVFIHSR